MPQFTEVTRLQAMALDAFFESVVKCCNRVTVMNNEGLFRSCVIAIRNEVYNRLPGPLMAEFATKFLEKFKLTLTRYNHSHFRVALEMIMDVEIEGLRVTAPHMNPGILRYLKLKDGRRLRKLVELFPTPIMIDCGTPMYRFLHTYHLNDLVIFKYVFYCTDDDLETIGQNCPRLESVEIFSSDVTEQGLRSLSSCTNLRVIHFRWCTKISHLGLNYLISAHENVEDFYYRYERDFQDLLDDPDIDSSSGLDVSEPTPSMSRLLIESYAIDGPALNLEVVANKFPNLVYLKINCRDEINLPALKHLNKLTGLEINFVWGLRAAHQNPARTWGHIEEVLTTIGSNITSLVLSARNNCFVCRQEQLNLMFNLCPNLEKLGFDHLFGLLVVPQSERLKVLTPNVTRFNLVPAQSYNLEFVRMSNLEDLSLPYSELDLQTIRSIMFDDNKFPKLSVLKIRKYYSFNNNDLQEIERTARDHNLNFRVEDYDDGDRISDYPRSESESESDGFDADGHDSSDFDDNDGDEGGDVYMESEEEFE